MSEQAIETEGEIITGTPEGEVIAEGEEVGQISIRLEDEELAIRGLIALEAAEEAGLRLDITAPQPQAPSMTMALENFIKDYNKSNGKP